nr:MAG TPA: hypothetical protein [Caudoviricetes sp.]
MYYCFYIPESLFQSSSQSILYLHSKLVIMNVLLPLEFVPDSQHPPTGERNLQQEQ